MRVSINERSEAGNVSGQTKYFVQGTADECRAILELLEDQAYDRAEQERALEQVGGQVLELDCTRLGDKAVGMQEGTDRVVELPSIDVSRLLKAVAGVYYAAWWQSDRPCENRALWTELRDAAGFEPGLATALLGPNGHHMSGLPKQGDGEPPLFYEVRDFLAHVLSEDNGKTVASRSTVHLTAKMFMARWRYRCGMAPKQGDDYYIEQYNTTLAPRPERFAEAAE